MSMKWLPTLTKKLDELVDELDCVVQRKGKGLMQGIEITKPVAEVNRRCVGRRPSGNTGRRKCDPFRSAFDCGGETY